MSTPNAVLALELRDARETRLRPLACTCLLPLGPPRPPDERPEGAVDIDCPLPAVSGGRWCCWPAGRVACEAARPLAAGGPGAPGRPGCCTVLWKGET